MPRAHHLLVTAGSRHHSGDNIPRPGAIDLCVESYPRYYGDQSVTVTDIICEGNTEEGHHNPSLRPSDPIPQSDP